MIPILSTTGTLTGQGLGRLTEALSCIVTHEVNGEYELRMTYPVTGERYADIAENLVVWAEPDNLTPAQAFRIYRITRPLNGIVTIYARHIAYDMSGIVVKPFTASTLTNALAAISPNSSPSCPFTLTSTRTVATQMKVSVPTVLWGLLGGQSGSFLDIYGGEWDFNNYTAELKTTLGTDRGVTVRYGKNLTKLEQDVTIEATYAGVFPYWYDEQSGVLVKLTSDYISIPGATGSRLLLLDLSDEWETAPTEVQLQARANAYITANDPGTPKISWKVNMAMLSQSEEFANLAILEQVMLGDTIHVYYEPMNLTASARAVKLEYDVLLERYNTVTLGRVKQNMAQIVAAEKKETAQNFKTMKSTLEKAIDSATDFITNPSGEMRFIYDANDVLQEIVVLDNPDISQAQSVWRLNSGGYGHSSTGYAGPYTLAITQNGAIVADFITAGTMAGNRVRTGMLEDETHTNYWNLDTGEFHIEALGNVGGRNILLNSATAKWEVVNGTTVSHTTGVSVAAWGCDDAITATGTCGYSNTMLQLFRTSQTSNIYLADTTYTFSCYLRNNHATNWIRFFANGGNDYEQIDPGETKRVCVRIQGDGVTALRMRLAANIGAAFDFTYWHPQIEYGEILTDWSPAPEDKVGNDEIISKINVSPESIVIQASKVDLAGYVTFTNLSTSGQTTIDGGNITTGLIKDAANKNSWNLTTGALTITDGSISITTNSQNDDKILLTYGNYQSSVKAGGFAFAYKNNGTFTTRSTMSLSGVNYYDYAGNEIARLSCNGPTTSGTASGSISCYKHNANFFAGFTAHGAGIGEDSNNGVCSTNIADNGIYVNVGNGSGFSQVIDLQAMPTYGYNYFNLKNANAKSAVYMEANSGGGIISVRDTTQTERVRVGIPAITFYDSSGNTTATYPAGGLCLGDLPSKNLAYKSFNGNTRPGETVNGVLFTEESYERMRVSGTCSSSFVAQLKVAHLVPGTYILSGTPSGGGTSTAYLNISGVANDTGSGATFTITTEGDYAIRMLFGTSTFSNLLFEPMIRKASITDGTYAPYMMSNADLASLPQATLLLSTHPIYYTKPNASNYGTVLVFGFAQGIGSVCLAVSITNGAIGQVRDLLSGSAFSSSYLGFSYSGNVLKITSTVSSNSWLTVIGA